jgi:adenylosuccinate synthase
MSKVGNGRFDTKVGETDLLPSIIKSIELDGATGKQRAYGWLDLNALRKSIAVNNPDDIIFTRTDLASFFPKICIKDGDEIFEFKPWEIDRDNPEVLKEEFLKFIEFVEKRVGVKVKGISYGRKTKEFIEI